MIKREGYKNNVYSNVSELPQKTLITYRNAEQQIAALLAKEIDYVIITRSSYIDWRILYFQCDDWLY